MSVIVRVEEYPSLKPLDNKVHSRTTSRIWARGKKQTQVSSGITWRMPLVGKYNIVLWWSSHIGFLIHKSMRVKVRLVSKIDWCFSNSDLFSLRLSNGGLGTRHGCCVLSVSPFCFLIHKTWGSKWGSKWSAHVKIVFFYGDFFIGDKGTRQTWKHLVYLEWGILLPAPDTIDMIFLCDNITPFGTPVEPLVYMMTARSSGMGRTRATSVEKLYKDNQIYWKHFLLDWNC